MRVSLAPPLLLVACGSLTSTGSNGPMPPDAAGDAVADAPRGFDGVVEARADTATDVAPPCTMGLVTLATGDPVGSLALDADNVYFGTDKDVMRVSKCGGPPTVLASDVGPIAIAVDA